MTDFKENLTKVGRSTSDDISLSRRRVKIRLSLKDSTERIVLTLTNIFYFPHSPSNLVSLNLINDVGIFHHNKDQILYNQKTLKILAFAERYNTNFLLYPFNLLIATVSLLKHDDIYESEKPNVNQT